MKQGQTTVFIVVGIILISIVLTIFLFKTGKIPSVLGTFEENPQKYLENCISPKVKEAINLLNEQGGQINPKLFKTFRFSDEKEYTNISYLCYTSKNYLPCVNREPILINSLEEEIKDYILEDFQKCLDNWENSAKKQGYSVNVNDFLFDVELEPKKIILNVNSTIELIKKEEAVRFEKFRIEIKDNIYDLAIVAQEIISQEAEYCNFNSQGFMLFYNEFDIKKFETSDLNTIYKVQDKKSQEEFKFAVRGCVIPAGM